jgi:enamine deaminase RidA (YjgF/YER057c/UK114 family)
MLGWRTDGSVGNETIEAEAGRIFDHLTHVLEEAGMGWAQVVHVRSYHRDRAQVQTVRELRAKRLPEGLFATTDVVTAPSLSGAALEIEIIAVGG